MSISKVISIAALMLLYNFIRKSYRRSFSDPAIPPPSPTPTPRDNGNLFLRHSITISGFLVMSLPSSSFLQSVTHAIARQKHGQSIMIWRSSSHLKSRVTLAPTPTSSDADILMSESKSVIHLNTAALNLNRAVSSCNRAASIFANRTKAAFVAMSMVA